MCYTVGFKAGMAYMLVACSLAIPCSHADGGAIVRPHGDYIVADVRRASDVAGGPKDHSLTWRPGQTLSMDSRLVLPDGRTCDTWHADYDEQAVVNVDDAVLSDTQLAALDSTSSGGDRNINRALELRCRDGESIRLLQADERVMIVASPSGQSYILLEKALSKEQVSALQAQLADMKFFDGTPSGEWSSSSRAAVSRYAEYRGAAFNFKRAVITENLLDGLDVLEPPAEGVLKILYAGDITAYFYGEPMELAPPEAGTKQLKFRFAGDDREYAFKPAGMMAFSDWSLEMFSPDGQYIALLQGHYGPYHIVKSQHLKAYLSGEQEPGWIASRLPEPGAGAAGSVYSDMRWTSPTSLEFSHTCCGDPIGQFWQVPDPQYPMSCSRDLVSLYRPDVAVQLDLLPMLHGLGKKGWRNSTQPADLVEAFATLEKARRAAIDSPGRWIKGALELGAQPRQYQPSDAELVACVVGREMLRLLDRKTHSRVIENWKGPQVIPPIVMFSDIRFREVHVQGSGLHYFTSGLEPVAFGPWTHTSLPPGLIPTRE